MPIFPLPPVTANLGAATEPSIFRPAQESAPARRSFELFLEGSSVSQFRNDVRVPGNGTNVSYRDLLGEGGKTAGRFTLLYRQNEDQGWRFVYAPLSFSGTGTLDQATEFNGATFAPGVATDGRYQFDSYRLSYWRRARGDARSEWRFGYTLKLRDAEVGLSQPGLSRTFRNTGLVPLIHFGGTYQFAPKFRGIVDFDGLIAPQGRALDLGLFLAYEAAPQTDVFLGFRALDGGADNKRTFNAAVIGYASAGVAIRF